MAITHPFQKSVLTLLLVFFANMVMAQTHTDSIKFQLKKSSGIHRLQQLNRLTDAYLYNNPDSACFFASELQKEAAKFNNPGYEALGYRGMSISHFFKMKYFIAEEDIQHAIKIQKELNDTSGLANSYKILTGIYWESERYKKSIDISYKALQLYEKTRDIKGIISSYNNIGLLYKKTGNPEKSLEYYKRALAYISKFNTGYNTGNLYNNMGITWKDLSQYDSALFYYDKAYRDYKKSGNLSGIATIFLNKGNIYAYHIIHSDSAMYYYRQALRLAQKSDYTIRADIYGGLAKVYADNKDFDQSLSLYQKVLQLANNHKDLDILKNTHYDLYNFYRKTGNLKKALYHMEEYNRLKDTLNMEKARVSIANLESKFENEKKQLQIEQLQIKHLADKKINILLVTGMLLLALIFALTVMVFIQKRKKARLRRELLDHEKQELEKDIQYKSRQLTSQALMMMQKNRMLDDILATIKKLHCIKEESKQTLRKIIHQLKRSIRADEDWTLFRHFFEEVNPDFYPKLLKINSGITPSELKLCALIKLNFSIKETASLLNISPDSVKTTRHVLRTKLGLARGENIYDFMNRI